MRLVRQPEGSGVCGQACVAMAAGVSLRRAQKIVGHGNVGGTTTRQIIAALRSLGVECSDKLVRLSRSRPTLPARCMVVVQRPAVSGERRRLRAHWILAWDGKFLDPGGRWPKGYANWRMTSYLEIRRPWETN